MQWIRRGGIAWTVIIPLAGLLAMRMAWPLLLVPQGALLIPAGVCWVGRRVGLAAALCLMGAFCMALGWAMGPLAALLALLTQLPCFVLSFHQYQRDGAFWPSAIACALLLLITATAALYALWVYTDHSPVTHLVTLAEAWIEGSPYKQDLLAMAWRYGLARTSDAAALVAGNGEAIQLSAGIQRELTQTLLITLETRVRGLLPSQIITGSMLGGVLSIAWPRWAAARDMDELHPPLAPPIHEWFLPNPLIGRVALLLLAFGLLAGTGGSALAMAVSLVWAAGACALALQGVAVADAFLRRRNVRRKVRTLMDAGAFIFFNGPCVLLGLLDAFLGLRKIPARGAFMAWLLPKDEQEDDE